MSFRGIISVPPAPSLPPAARHRIKRLYALCAAAGLLILASSAHSDPRSPKQAVVRLSAEHLGCGSGFFVEDGAALVTNAHVVELLCAGTVCPSLRIDHDSGQGHFESALPADTVDLKVRLRLPSIDLAILDLPPSLRSPFSLEFSTATAPAGAEISLLGYPGCLALEETRGAISDITTTSFLSGARGASGSSGGPVLDASGNVVGVAFQSDSLLRPIYDAVGRGSYPLRAVRAELLHTLFATPASTLRSTEAGLLLELYSKDVAPFGGLIRLKRGLQFLNSARMLANTILGETGRADFVRAAAQMDRAPEAILQRTAPSPETPAGKEMELLSFVTNLESRGLMSGAARRMTPERLSATLQAQGYTPEDITRFLSFLPRPEMRNNPGIIPLLALIGAVAMACSAAIITLWAGSLGYVYARGRGGRIRRLARTLAVAVLFWPVSLIMLRVFAKRSASAKPALKKSAPVSKTER